jgi:hypothetical protein
MPPKPSKLTQKLLSSLLQTSRKANGAADERTLIENTTAKITGRVDHLRQALQKVPASERRNLGATLYRFLTRRQVPRLESRLGAVTCLLATESSEEKHVSRLLDEAHEEVKFTALVLLPMAFPDFSRTSKLRLVKAIERSVARRTRTTGTAREAIYFLQGIRETDATARRSLTILASKARSTKVRELAKRAMGA